MLRSLAFFLVVAATAAACSSSSVGSKCASAGGTCVLGGVACAKNAPDDAQDCNTNPPNPGGGHCCLSVADSGGTD